MNKKSLSLLLVVVMLLSIVLTGCGGEEVRDDGRVNIRFINGFTGGDGGYMKKITNAFNESQDKYFVEELQEKDHYTKFKSDDFDLVVIHANNIKTYVDDGLIQDMDGIYEKMGISLDDFHPVAEKIALNEEKLYGLPLDVHPLTMFYNKEFVKEAPETYEDLLKINDELQEKDENLYATGIPASGLVEFLMLTIAGQNDVDLVEDGYLNFANEDFAKGLMQYHDMIWEDKISPSGLGLDGEFQAFMKESEDNASVQTAVAFTGPWMYTAAKEKYGEDLGIGKIPVIGEKEGAYGNAHLICLPSNVEDEEKIEGITEYLKFMFTPENLINWADAGQSPVHKGTMELVEENKDKYELAYYNQAQFDSFIQAPDVYQFGEQMRYMNENVFAKVVSEENLDMDTLMKELEEATEIAKQIAEKGK